MVSARQICGKGGEASEKVSKSDPKSARNTCHSGKSCMANFRSRVTKLSLEITLNLKEPKIQTYHLDSTREHGEKMNEGDGNSDHQCCEGTEDMDTPRTLYKINSSSLGTEAAAAAAAEQASAYVVFKSVNSNYSTKLLKGSQSLFKFANKYRGSYQASCPFYCSNSLYQDELLWAAAWLYKATKDNQYLEFVSNNQCLSSVGVAAVQCSSTSFPTTQIKTFAKSQVDYILGNNPLNISYMVGFRTNYPKRIHHRGTSIPSIKVISRKVTCNEGFTSWYSTQNSNPNTHLGAIVGGPDSNDQFHDVRSDSTHLEPTTYINAALLSEKDCLQLPGGISRLADYEDASYYAN